MSETATCLRRSGDGRSLARGAPRQGRLESTLLLRRERYIGQGMREDLVLENLAGEPLPEGQVGFGPQKMCELTDELFERNRHLLGPDEDQWVGQRISRGVHKVDGDNWDHYGPTVIVEYDNSPGGANHVHSVWRASPAPPS